MGIITNHIDFTRDYTQLPNTWLRDGRLSRRARGLLAEIMTNRDGWDTSVDYLVKNGPEGQKAIQSAIRELVQYGYLRREVIPREGGGLAGSRYVTQAPENAFPDRSGMEPQTTPFLTGQEGATKNTNRKNTKKNTKAPADADAAFEAFWDSYPATRKGGKDGPKGAKSKYKTLARELTEQGLMDRLQHYKRTRARLERSGEFVPAVPHVTTWLNQHRWDDFGEYKPGPVELTADEVNQILGPDHWAPESPDGGFQTVEEELEWRQAAYAARLAERKQRAKEVMTGGTVRQDS